MCYDKLLVAFGTFGISYLVFNKYPQIFIKRFYNLYPISKFDNYFEINVGKRIIRPICHKIDKNIIKIEARGIDIYGEHPIHIEIKESIIMGLPKIPSDIGFKSITIEVYKGNKEFSKDSVEILHFGENDKISFSSNIEENISLDHILDSDCSE